MSAKNQLQEIFQRRGLILPIYQSERIGGPSHDPVWVSQVELSTGSRVRGDESKSKIQAEQSAAEKALIMLRTPQTKRVILERPPTTGKVLSINQSGSSSEEKRTPSPIKREQSLVKVPSIDQSASLLSVEKRTCLLIDGENLPNLAKVASSFSRPGLEILIFVGHHHHLSERDYGVPKVLVPTTHANGVDSCMQVYVGTFLQTNKYDRYLIGTRDHFGSALIDLIQSSEMPWTAKTAILVTTETHLKKQLA